MNGKWIIVGISGCTNSGKTTLSSFLASYFPNCVIINQDKYFRSDDDPAHIVVPELNHKNWESLQAVNWDAMMEKIKYILQTPPQNIYSLLIIEGHIIFNYSALEKFFHKKYFIEMDKDECYKRRVLRVYDPPDIPNYFEKCVWPMYLSNLEQVKKCKDVIYLKGTDEKEFIQKTVIENMQEYLKENIGEKI